MTVNVVIGRPDPTVAKEAWDTFLLRNQSIVTEMFMGQLKSKVTCQTCFNVSVTFDPYSILPLPIQMDQKKTLKVDTSLTLF